MTSRIWNSVERPRRALAALNATSTSGRRLYYGRPSSAGRMLLARLLATIFLVSLVVLAFSIGRDGLRDSVDGHVSFIDVFYFSMVTITTVGYGDIVPVTDSARLFDAILVTPVRLVIGLIFLGTAYQLGVLRIVEELRMRIRQSELEGHVIFCGFGLAGTSAVGELLSRGTSRERIVVIDVDEAALERAAEMGLVGIRGDATREATLADARVSAARTVIVSLGRDDTSVLSVLTVRALAPDLRIVAVVKDVENEPLLRRAGASATVCPSTLGGVLMANSLENSHIARYMTDMLTNSGRVLLHERMAGAQDIGKGQFELSDGIVLRIMREGRDIGFWEASTVVREGDRLLVLSPRKESSG